MRKNTNEIQVLKLQHKTSVSYDLLQKDHLCILSNKTNLPRNNYLCVY